MEHRKLPHGGEEIGVLGIGTGSLHAAPPEEIRAVAETAVANGINFFDLCAGGKSVYEPFGRAIEGRRKELYFQLHFGAVYNAAGEYAWSRDLSEIKETFAREMKALRTDYVDFGFLHCIDDDGDFDDIMRGGIFDYVTGLRRDGVLRHIGFSSPDGRGRRRSSAPAFSRCESRLGGSPAPQKAGRSRSSSAR